MLIEKLADTESLLLDMAKLSFVRQDVVDASAPKHNVCAAQGPQVTKKRIDISGRTGEYYGHRHVDAGKSSHKEYPLKIVRLSRQTGSFVARHTFQYRLHNSSFSYCRLLNFRGKVGLVIRLTSN